MSEDETYRPTAEARPIPSVRQACFDLGRALDAAGRFEEAAAELERALKESAAKPEEPEAQPTAYEILVELASVHDSNGNQQGAAKAYARAAGADTNELKSMLDEASSLVTRDTGRAFAAWLVDEWRQEMDAKSLDPGQRLQVLLFIADVHIKAEDRDKAVEWFHRADTLATVDPSLWQAAGMAFYNAGSSFLDRNEILAALDLLRLANARVPEHRLSNWTLMDALRMKSALPETAEEAKADIDESLKLWNLAIAQAWPDESDYWAYLARASVNERIALDARQDRWSLGWEALTYCERAAVLGPHWAANFSNIGRWSRFLNLEAYEYEATQQAMSLDENDSMGVEERLMCLANTGRYDELSTLLEQRRASNPSPWLDGVEAYAKVRQADPEAALPLIGNAIDEFPNMIWCREVRAECYRQLGRLDDMRSDYQYILERFDPEDLKDHESSAVAAYRLAIFGDGDMSRAVDSWTDLLRQSFPNDYGALLYLGLCHLAKGDLDAGRELFLRGIHRTNNPRELEDLLSLDLADFEKACARLPHGAAVLHLLNDDGGLRDALRERISQGYALREATSSQTARQELEEALALAATADPGGWLRAGCGAALARLSAAEKDWSGAADSYLELFRNEPQRFPEAKRALSDLSLSAEQAGHEASDAGNLDEAENCFSTALRIDGELGNFLRLASLHETVGDALLKGGRLDSARVHYEQGLAAGAQIEGGTGTGEAGRVYARIGYIQFQVGETQKAYTSFEQALERFPADEDGQPGDKLGEQLRRLIPDFEAFWDLEDFLDAAPEAIRGNQELRSNLRTYLDKLDAELDSDKSIPIVTPIVWKISDVLVPFVDPKQDDGHFLYTLIPAMRERIQKVTGLSVPGVRARSHPPLTPGLYELQIDETPVNRASVPVDCWFFSGPLADGDLADLGQHCWPAFHPVTAASAWWLDGEGRSFLERTGRKAWTTPELLIDCIETVILQNMTAFAGLQEAENVLTRWEQDPASKKLIAAALPTPKSRYRFASLLRALAEERVPVSNWEPLLNAVKDLGIERAGMGEMVRAVRLRLRPELPGNSSDAIRVAVPAVFEDQLGGATDSCVGRTQASRFLTWLREEMKSRDGLAVLVTRSGDLRPLLRKFIAPEFPGLMVLAEEELASGGEEASPIDDRDLAAVKNE